MSSQLSNNKHTPELLEYLQGQNCFTKHIESSNNSVVSAIIKVPLKKRRNMNSCSVSNKIVVKEIKHKVEGQHCEQCYDLKNEVEKLKEMKHPHIIALQENKIYEFRMSCAIFLPKALEDLFDYMIKYNVEDNLKSLKICFYQIGQAIKYLHQVKNMVHGDVKPENIFVFSEEEFKLADFGFCKKYQKFASREEFIRQYTSRSLKYHPPEFVDCLEQPNFNLNLIDEYSSDVFGLGVALFQLVFKQCPYYEEAEFQYSTSTEKKQPVQQIQQSNKDLIDISQVNITGMISKSLKQINIHRKLQLSPESTNNTNKTPVNSPSNSTSPPQMSAVKKKKQNKRKYYHRQDKLYGILYQPNNIEEFWNHFKDEIQDMIKNTDLSQEDIDILKDLILKCITPFHYLRVGIDDFLAHPFFSDISDNFQSDDESVYSF
ncbi:kinase domain protein (macronuclear) [Tetrahymena thermophila SB210]|uniref:Kinase domain protein n=1 Tax=Tetrahymena thermophila (strain SB210) TaxID=312017 RepID=I7MLX6_TETTS|nr:kinase domain protein [Tetrahymena thermophila SB210]EAS03251.1 kinase domain protein [Tetrahymena thermophila SB210]|eukprot:XP_001023496.1 kinase domain protein [Tetrahymena thermophila SB210]